MTEAAREFITGVADVVTCSGAQGQEPPARGEAQSWVTGAPRQQLPAGKFSREPSVKRKSVSPNGVGILAPPGRIASFEGLRRYDSDVSCCRWAVR